MKEFESDIRATYGDGVETRTMEVRAADNMTITGYASVFGDTYD